MIKNKYGFTPILVILLVIIIGVSTYILLKKSSTVSNPITTSTPSSTSILPEESIKDGVYTNTKYKFTFKYPNNIFSHTILNIYGTNNENFYRQFFINENGLSDSLSVSINSNSNSISTYEKYQELPLNTQYPALLSYINLPKSNWPGSVLVKIKNLNLNNNNSGIIIKGYPSGGGISEGEEYYQASWKIENKIYSIILLTAGKNSLDKYTIIFNNIVNSFQLLP